MRLSGRPSYHYYLLATFLLLVPFAIGYYLAMQNPFTAREILNNSLEKYRYLHYLPSWPLFAFIFLNNFIKTFLVVALGFLLGLPAILFLIVNGEVIGEAAAISTVNISPAFSIAALLPHGILEVPAIIISSAYGIWLGTKFLQNFKHPGVFNAAYKIAFAQYFKVVFPLLLLAAFIEVFVTPIFITAVLKITPY